MQDYQGVIHVDSHAFDSRTNNQAARFTNYLPSRFIYTDNDYEIGLTEIQFPQSWYNLPTDQYVGAFDKERKPLRVFKIPAGHYENIDSLIDTVNAGIYEFFVDPDAKPPEGVENLVKSIIYYDVGKKIRLFDVTPTIGFEILFTMELAQIFGFTDCFFQVYTKKDWEALRQEENIRITSIFPGVKLVTEGEVTALKENTQYMAMRYQARFHRHHIPERPFDITGGTDQLFIYCNLIKPHVFGNQIKQILRVIPVYQTDLTNFGQITTRSFSNPQFFPLFETSFDKIEIEIRDRLGILIPFKSGSVILALEIRRKKDGGLLF